ncbi:hypothetical protein Tco_0836279 [Tanacetum coccineum]
MNYIPVSLQNQANPAGSTEVIDIDEQTKETADLMVVSSTSLKEATRKAAVSEKIATKKTHSSKQPSSTPISKSAEDIMTFRTELDALALKHLGPVPATVPTSTNPVNTGSINPNTALICLSTGRVYNFSKLIFDGMMANLKNKKKFLMTRTCCSSSNPTITSTSTYSLTNTNTYPTSTSPPPIIPSPTPPPLPTPTSSPPPPPETAPPTDEHINEEQSPVHHHFSPSQVQAPSHMPINDLLQTVPKLSSRIDSLELDLKQTKLTMGNAIVKLVKKVQGRNSQANPQDSSKQGLVTPPTTKAHASGEEQEEEISPNTLEAAKTLSKVASATLSTFLEKHGYQRGTIDKTLFIKKDKKDIILVQIYVDDIIFGSTKKSWSNEFEALMKGSVKSAVTPMKTKAPLAQDEGGPDVDLHLYRSMIGCLMYLTASRPDIMYAVCACSRL